MVVEAFPLFGLGVHFRGAFVQFRQHALAAPVNSHQAVRPRIRPGKQLARNNVIRTVIILGGCDHN